MKQRSPENWEIWGHNGPDFYGPNKKGAKLVFSGATNEVKLNEGKLNEFMYAKLGSKVEKFVKQYYGKNKFVSLPAWKVTMTYPDQPGRTHDQWVKAKSAKDAIQISKKMWSNQNIKVGKAIFDDEHWLRVQKAQKTGFTEGEIKIKKESVNEGRKVYQFHWANGDTSAIKFDKKHAIKSLNKWLSGKNGRGWKFIKIMKNGKQVDVVFEKDTYPISDFNESVNEKFVKYASGQWVVFYEKGTKDIPIKVVGSAAAAKKLMNSLRGKYKNIGRSERKEFEKYNGKIKESVNERWNPNKIKSHTTKAINFLKQAQSFAKQGQKGAVWNRLKDAGWELKQVMAFTESVNEAKTPRKALDANKVKNSDDFWKVPISKINKAARTSFGRQTEVGDVILWMNFAIDAWNKGRVSESVNEGKLDRIGSQLIKDLDKKYKNQKGTISTFNKIKKDLRKKMPRVSDRVAGSIANQYNDFLLDKDIKPKEKLRLMVLTLKGLGIKESVNESVKVRRGETAKIGKWEVYNPKTNESIKEVGSPGAATRLMNRLMSSGQYDNVASRHVETYKKESIKEKISKDEWAQYPKYARKLKPYLQKLFKVPIRVRVIKQANHNPWIEVRVARFGKDIIPNDFRVKAAKVIGASGVRDWDNVNYGNIRVNSISLKADDWKKLLGKKVK